MTGRTMLIAALLAGAAGPHALAQSTGTPNGQGSVIVADGSTRTAIEGSDGGTIFIGGGSIAGDNLFHSFGQFDLARGETAAWVGPGSIANIINRVTGNTASHIEGTIDTSAMPLADFWFINPNGVLFGQGAALNVPGASYFSTATDLRFANGEVFSARTERGSTLSMASPASFGFLGGEADIAMTGVGRDPLTLIELGVPAQSSLALVALDVRIDGSGLLLEDAQFIAAGTADRVPVDFSTLPLLDGTLSITGSSIVVPGGETSSGNSHFAGGTVLLDDALIGTRAIDAAGPQLSFLASDRIEVTGANLTSRTSGSGAAGQLVLSAGNSIAIADTFLGSGSLDGAQGAGGAIRLSSFGAIDLTNSTVLAFSEAGGAGGEIAMIADGDMTLTATDVLTQTLSEGAGGDGGDIGLFAGGRLTVAGSTLAADTRGDGAGGEMFVLSQGSLLIADSTLTSNTLGREASGAGGLVSIGSQVDIAIDGSTITAASLGNGNGGTVFVNAGTDLSIADSRFFSQAISTTGTGSAGSILLRSGGDTVLSETSLTADTFGRGEGGDIGVTADGALSVTGGELSSDTLAPDGGNGGFVRLGATGPAVLTGVTVSTDTFGSGAGGSVSVGSDAALTVTSSEISADTVDGDGTGGFVSLSSGAGMTIGQSQIFADTYGLGRGGDVALNAAGPLAITGGYISAESLSEGEGGNGGGVLLQSPQSVTISAARISTDTSGGGDAGFLQIVTGDLVVRNAARLVSETFGAGEGGIVSLSVDTLDLTNATIAANTDGSGDSQGVLVQVRQALIGEGAEITSSSNGSGDAGIVYVGGDFSSSTPAELIRITDGGRITAAGTGTGAAGTVRMITERLELLDGGFISTSASNRLPAGSIVIDADSLLVDGAGGDADRASRIVSANIFDSTVSGGGNTGGDIIITTSGATISNGGQLNTSSRTGDAGLIFLDFADSQGILRLLGRGRPGIIRTDSTTGSGGNIGIDGAYAIIADGSEISASGDVSNAFVSIDPATVRIGSTDNSNVVNVSGIASVAPEQDVGSATTVSEVPFIDASGVLQGRCAAARSQGRASRLDVQELGPYSLSVQVDEAYRRVAAAAHKGACL